MSEIPESGIFVIKKNEVIMKIESNRLREFTTGVTFKSGIAYYKQGKVCELSITDPGKVTATVEGTQLYQVTMALEDDYIVEPVCSCPDLRGPICKHIIAVVEYLLKGEPVAKAERLGTRKAIEKKEPKRKELVIEQLLKDQPVERILRFITMEALSDRSFYERLVEYFKIESHDGKNYKQVIASLIRQSKSRGYISYSKAMELGRRIGELQFQVIMNPQVYPPESVYALAMAVLTEMDDIFNYADDSSGSLGDVINMAFDMLDKLDPAYFDAEKRVSMFNTFLAGLKNSGLSGFGFDLYFSNVVLRFLETGEQEKKLLSVLDSMKIMDWNHAAIIRIKEELLLKSGKVKEAEALLVENRFDWRIMQRLLQKEFETGNYDLLDKYISEAMASHKDFSGIIADCLAWKLKSLKAQKKDKEYTDCCFQLIFEGREPIKAFIALKDSIEKDQWPAAKMQVIQRLVNKKYINVDLLTQIYLQEEMFQELFELARQKPQLLFQFQDLLYSKFPQEYLSDFKEVLKREAVHANGRPHYAELARHLRKLKKMGEVDSANELCEEFRKKYSNRPAMLQELSLV